jgi:surface antigen
MSLAHTKTATLKQQVFGRHRPGSKKAKNGLKSTTVAAYTGVFLLIMSMVAIGYQPPQKVDSVANAVNPLASGSPVKTDQPSVDQIVATNVAAGIAARADLPIAANIANQSISLSVQSQLAQTDSNTIVKPQIIQPSADSRTIKQYTVKAGDTVTSIAQQYGVSPDTVKWANNLSSDTVSPDTQLKILPVDGILYTVKDGDTIDSIATKFNTTVQNITVFNDLELSGLVQGAQIVLPSGVLPATERPGYVAPRTYGTYNAASVLTTRHFAGGFAGGSSLGSWANTKATTPGNTNAWGNCTWWAWERRNEMGMPLPSGALGNAAEWSYTLAQAGHRVDSTPSYGAIIQNGGGYGHVGVVEVVNDDGSIVISEMNNYAAGGYNIIDKRVIPAYAIGNFNYIH